MDTSGLQSAGSGPGPAELVGRRVRVLSFNVEVLAKLKNGQRVEVVDEGVPADAKIVSAHAALGCGGDWRLYIVVESETYPELAADDDLLCRIAPAPVLREIE